MTGVKPSLAIALLGLLCGMGVFAQEKTSLPAPHAKAGVHCYDCHQEEKPTKKAKAPKRQKDSATKNEPATNDPTASSATTPDKAEKQTATATISAFSFFINTLPR